MVWRFLKQYGMSKASDVLDEFASAVVAFDPEVASRAQIKMMEAELRKLGEMRDPQGVPSRLRDMVADPNALTFEEILFGNIVAGRGVYSRQ